jgi:hypothetical protein
MQFQDARERRARIVAQEIAPEGSLTHCDSPTWRTQCAGSVIENTATARQHLLLERLRFLYVHPKLGDASNWCNDCLQRIIAQRQQSAVLPASQFCGPRQQEHSMSS